MKAAKPHVLLLVLDSARADHFSCYGYSRKTTPNFDRLAESGTLFMRSYSSANETLPSHVSIFTGVPPYFHKAAGNHGIYEGKYPFITEVLQNDGYSTIGVTNNTILCKYRGFERGFDVYHRLWEKEGAARSPRELLNRFVELLDKEGPALSKLRTLAEKLYTGPARDIIFRRMEKRYLTEDQGGKRIVKILKDEIKKATEKPTFLFANILETHSPFLAPKPFRGKFYKGRIPRSVFDAMTFKAYEFMIDRVPFTEGDRHVLNACYDECLAYADALMGELFEFMNAEGVMDDFLIIVTSDHGEMLAEKPGLIGHGDTTYDGMMRVPLLIRYPDRFSAGKKVNVLAQHIDIFPTIIGAVGLDQKLYASKHKGIDLGGDLSRQKDRCIVLDQPYITNPERLRKYKGLLERWNHVERTLVCPEYKYTWITSGKHRLYNISKDPSEEKNIYKDAPKEIIDKLHSMLVKWYEDQLDHGETFDLAKYEYREVFWEGITKDLRREEEEAIKKRLRELGYLR